MESSLYIDLPRAGGEVCPTLNKHPVADRWTSLSPFDTERPPLITKGNWAGVRPVSIANF